VDYCGIGGFRPTGAVCGRARTDWRVARADLTLGLRYGPQSAQRVRDMVQQVRECCAFLTFQIHEQPDEVLLTITAPEEARATVDALFEPFLPSKAPPAS
jgi:hypothetical protein